MPAAGSNAPDSIVKGSARGRAPPASVPSASAPAAGATPAASVPSRAVPGSPAPASRTSPSRQRRASDAALQTRRPVHLPDGGVVHLMGGQRPRGQVQSGQRLAGRGRGGRGATQRRQAHAGLLVRVETQQMVDGPRRRTPSPCGPGCPAPRPPPDSWPGGCRRPRSNAGRRVPDTSSYCARTWRQAPGWPEHGPAPARRRRPLPTHRGDRLSARASGRNVRVRNDRQPASRSVSGPETT